MTLSVDFQSRTFGTAPIPPDVVLTVERYSWDAIGGPADAVISARSESAFALWELLSYLRVPLTIRNDEDDAKWWGIIHEVRVRVGALEIGASLDTMANRVAILYESVTPGSSEAGVRAVTDWAEDTFSTDLYGDKELRISRGGCLPAVAEAQRDAELARRKYPIKAVDVVPDSDENVAEIYCRGYWSILDWTYFSRDAGIEEHTDGSQTQRLGETSDNEEVAQSFELSGTEAWDANNVSIKIRTEGSPADNVTIYLCDDNAGEPGSTLASATVAASAITNSLAWVNLDLSSVVSLSLSTTYWIRVARSGAVDEDNYYVVSVDEDLGYANGSFLVYDGTNWNTRTDDAGDPADADMLFRVGGVEETTVQLSTIVDDEGQFISGVDLIDASGIYTSQYRNGDMTALHELEALLAAGTTDDRRLLATITEQRILRIYEEPQLRSSTIELFVGTDGLPRDKFTNPLDPANCPVALWCGITDVPAMILETEGVQEAGYFFVERAEYDATADTWRPEPRDAPGAYDVGAITDG
jgi:hypothetical protein